MLAVQPLGIAVTFRMGCALPRAPELAAGAVRLLRSYPPACLSGGSATCRMAVDYFSSFAPVKASMEV